MITWSIPSIFGSKNERELHRIRPIVGRINDIEAKLQSEPSEKLRELTDKWREHLARYHPLDLAPKSAIDRMDEAGLKQCAESLQTRFSILRKEFASLPAEIAATPEAIEQAKAAFHHIEDRFAKARAKYLLQILPEAYAVVKNAARRLCGSEVLVSGQPLKWDMVHFDVQLIGGIALHRGLIAEMQTGEGKTLVATLPVYLNALTGLGVHVVTVNDYLARRDSEWMGALYQSLGLSVGCLQNQMPPAERRRTYACDITYGTNSEFGFDYLRDNGMAQSHAEQVQRGHYLAILDEVDSILIDDARTPLIISGPAEQSAQPLLALKPGVEKLVKRQTALCNQLAAEVEQQLKAGDEAAAGLALLKLKLGQPRHRRFLRFLESPELRRLLEKTELRYQRQSFQRNIHGVKEELYFCVDEKRRDADLMEKGRLFLAPEEPDTFTLPDIAGRLAAIDADPALSRDQRAAARQTLHEEHGDRAAAIHGISQLLAAYCLHERDVHYVVRGGKVTIIDESTGREMPGRRWSDGLHQAVEAKEGVEIEEETKTYASITIQNYFRLYEKLAGMTGTAETAAAEFHDIYRLDVLPIPTHAPNLRIDRNDQLFKTRRDKYQAVIRSIDAAHQIGQPVLVGTASVEASETLSRMLKLARIPHAVLNAKHHEQEAGIIARAGERGAVTVSTNMAGRGTDIKLGEGVAELGGLLVIGTERHASRRVDRQLRGRCSRQGDPGASQFFISLEDDLMRTHGDPAQMAALIEQAKRGGAKAPSLGKLVEAAQTQLEQRDAKGRKQVLDFDDVMNLQREIVYDFRSDVLTTEGIHGLALQTIEESVARSAHAIVADGDSVIEWAGDTFLLETDELSGLAPQELIPEISRRVRRSHEQRLADVPPEFLEADERRALLFAIDHGWQEHLADMEELREGVFLRSQGQKDPLVEYKNEAFGYFNALMDRIKNEASLNLFHLAASVEAMRASKQVTPPSATRMRS
ncbi:preprotein translocase subunit SecA [Haloferula rosea]|uniref:Protein translocase subunit SecA n=1 Tax=Haloferula rosea TaxID=490093 RepID=A0A934VGX8_9BACT|nr:preprotein translocase subunit SecA [Haloferula rosea]MBK1828497.1 preprotein translocase subunit SecA [Haloferula rosea]